MKTALSIAGSDTSGGAGIQADLKTMTMNGVFAMSAITALTAQNTTGVQGIFEVTPEFLGMQIDSVFTDIRPDAVKIGMVSSVNLISVIAEKLTAYHAENIVVDPVMVATSGAKLISVYAVSALKEKLLPLATVVTPNIPEAEVLADMKITSPEDMVTAAEIISKAYHCAVLCKGGHSMNDANDLLYDEKGALITPIPMAQAVRFPVRLRQIWQRATTWKPQWSGQRNISPVRWRQCLIWAQAAAR